MDNFLCVVEQDSVKYFTNKVKIWDYFSISQQKFSSLSLEERTSRIKKHYHDLDARFQDAKCSLFLGFLFLLLAVVIAIAVKKGFWFSVIRKCTNIN